eukprot:jgi/Chlat1/9249/Chrsp99S08520
MGLGGGLLWWTLGLVPWLGIGLAIGASFPLLYNGFLRRRTDARKQAVKWLNNMVAEMWTNLDKAVSKIVVDSVTPILQASKPAFIESLTFENFSLGKVPPTVEGVEVVETPDEEAVIIEMEVKWDGDPQIVLHVRTSFMSLNAKVTDWIMRMKLRFMLRPLMNELPVVGCVVMTLTEKPEMDFTIDALGGSLQAIPGLDATIDSIIRDNVGSQLVWPRRIVIPLDGKDHSELNMHPVGMLQIKLIDGHNFVNLDIIGKSNPKVYFSVNPTIHVKSKAYNAGLLKRGALNPVWNEEFFLPVEDYKTQTLLLRVMDDDKFKEDELMGVTNVKLTDLTPGQEKEFEQDIFKKPGTSEPPRGRIHFKVTYKQLNPQEVKETMKKYETFYGNPDAPGPSAGTTQVKMDPAGKAATAQSTSPAAGKAAAAQSPTPAKFPSVDESVRKSTPAPALSPLVSPSQDPLLNIIEPSKLTAIGTPPRVTDL